MLTHNALTFQEVIEQRTFQGSKPFVLQPLSYQTISGEHEALVQAHLLLG